ncbi:right-handed parallel beta-helix repeat-containing protein [Mucilaginibacter sp. cycad4]|uniref:right-handed parallel beta-helix repeat-containing protein n=1 Tax=Mucilaginibacter sp. cycad4 TaxID=3342096 RepID=UPI002AABA700|nr:right-handed parallel beta-helix repeat-containing protein [Mucilaginibacter gossypii]WPV00232.1 right-handed parallel beta-helix repeat-containing protein [Mucilaginibacter gossypii]
MKVIRLVFFLIAGASFNAFSQTALYVSPTGKGATFSSAAPGNIYLLQQKLQDLKAANTKDVTVYLKGGTYNMVKSLIFTNAELGGSDSKLLITNAPGEKPILSGGKKITGWTPYKDGIYQAPVPANFNTRQLYINGKIAVRARYPNRDNDDDYGPYFLVKSFDTSNKKVIINASEAGKWGNLANVEMVINQHWYQSRMLINSITKQGSTAAVSLSGPQAATFFSTAAFRLLDPNKSYYFENAMEFLDSENEWYLDNTKNIIYYKPKAGTDLNSAEVIAPLLSNIIKINGAIDSRVKNIQISNIEFAYTTWLLPGTSSLIIDLAVTAQRKTKKFLAPGLIEVNYADNFTLSNCTLHSSGANGLIFGQGVSHSLISKNHIYDMCGNGIVIDTYNKPNPPATIQCIKNVISGNLIENVGLNYTNGMGIIANCVANHLFENNEIREGRYTGIEVGNEYGDKLSGTQYNLIRKNNIHHVMLLHDDGAAIYTLSNQPGTQIYENWVHDMTKSKWADAFPINGIYLDDNSAFIKVQNNTLENFNNAIKLKQHFGNSRVNTHDNIIMNNDKSDNSIKAASGVAKQ